MPAPFNRVPALSSLLIIYSVYYQYLYVSITNCIFAILIMRLVMIQVILKKHRKKSKITFFQNAFLPKAHKKQLFNTF